MDDLAESRNGVEFESIEKFYEAIRSSRLPVVVEFIATWSGTCHIMAPIVEKLTLDFQGRLSVLTLDVEENAEIAEHFGIATDSIRSPLIPSFLLFVDGKLGDHLTQSVPESVLKEKFEGLISEARPHSESGN